MPDWTAIVGIVTAAGVGLVGTRFSDHRRFDAERKVRSGDDLLRLIDDVEVALDQLATACADLRSKATAYLHPNDSRIRPSLDNAHDAYQHARAVIARLSMRPHASDDLVAHAKTAAGRYQEVTLRVHSQLHLLDDGQAIDRQLLGVLAQRLKEGDDAMRDYEKAARIVVGKLLGAPAAAPDARTRPEGAPRSPTADPTRGKT